MADITRKNFVEAAAAMGVMGPMAAMLGTLGASSAQAATIGATDDHIKGPEHPVRTEEEAVKFLFNPEIATEDYTCADGTVIHGGLPEPAQPLESPGCGLWVPGRRRRQLLGTPHEDLHPRGGRLVHGAADLELFTANDYHAVSGRPEAECREICNHLAMKGVLPRFVRAGVPHYYLTNQHLGQPMYYREEGYLGAGMNGPDATGLQYDQGTPTYQVVPVNSDVVAETEILPYDDWQAVIDRNEVFVMTPCVCKSMQASFKGDFSWEDDHEARYDDGVGHSFRIDTFYGKGSEVICQCHSDSCFLLGALRSVDGVGDAVLAMSNYTLELDKDACLQCGACIERCPCTPSPSATTATPDGRRLCPLRPVRRGLSGPKPASSWPSPRTSSSTCPRTCSTTGMKRASTAP